MFKHDIFGDQQEIPDNTPNTPNFLSLEFFASLRCPLVLASFEDAIIGVHRREVVKGSVEVPLLRIEMDIHLFFLMAPMWPLFVFFLRIYHCVTNDTLGTFMRCNFCNGPNMFAWTYVTV